MRIALADRNKQSMFHIDEVLHLTYDSPGPVEVDISSLPDQAKQQLLYNLRRGVLATDTPELLIDVTPLEGIVAKSYATPHERPITATEPIKDTEQLAEAQVKELKKLLKKTVPTIQAAMAQLRPGQMQALIELEKQGKSRKRLLETLEKQYAKYCQGVAEAIGGVDLMESDDALRQAQKALREGVSTNVSDVVESESEEVTFTPGE